MSTDNKFELVAIPVDDEVENYIVGDLERAWTEVSTAVFSNYKDLSGDDRRSLLERIYGMIDHLDHKECGVPIVVPEDRENEWVNVISMVIEDMSDTWMCLGCDKTYDTGKEAIQCNCLGRST